MLNFELVGEGVLDLVEMWKWADWLGGCKLEFGGEALDDG